MEGGAAARVASLLTIHNIFPVLKRKFLLDYSSAGGAALFDQLGGAGAKQWKPGGPWAIGAHVLPDTPSALATPSTMTGGLYRLSRPN
jgi:hypothetical protein